MQKNRLMGTTADAGITNVTEEQLVEISKSSLVLDVGIQQRLGSVDTEQLRNARLGVVWINDTEWEHHRLPTISGVVGNYPLSKRCRSLCCSGAGWWLSDFSRAKNRCHWWKSRIFCKDCFLQGCTGRRN